MFSRKRYMAGFHGHLSHRFDTRTITRTQPTGDVITGIKLLNTGQLQSGTGNPTISWSNITDQWQLPLDSAIAALYEVQATEVSRADPSGNAVFSGTLITWLGLGSNRQWTLTQPEDVGVNAEWKLDFIIRNIVSTDTVASGRITLQSRVV